MNATPLNILYSTSCSPTKISHHRDMNVTSCTLNFYPTETLHYRHMDMTPLKYPVYHTMIILKYNNADT